MIEQIEKLGQQALQEIERCKTANELEGLRLKFLGKKGELSHILKGLGGLSPEERPRVGAAANAWRAQIEEALETSSNGFERKNVELKLQREKIDLSLPPRRVHQGSLHVITQTTQLVLNAFLRLGFDIVTGPEAETEFLNFEAVNIPVDHPARDMQDTFFLAPGVVLRTHTSSVQMRSMFAGSWPIRILCPGAVYRCDNDATHSPMFHQIEGLWVDQGVKMSDLKGVLGFFARELFGSETKIRLRPSYFPFVEPGAEMDVSCFACGKTPKSSCRVCRGSGWLEILGAGMVHPELFKIAGYADKTSALPTGFAFGIGVERIAMLLHEIPDLRLMYGGDMRFLSQF